ncbi:hypothetical protein PIIN_08736 [Serendipita indica DSM 11827]|uniref:Uncharacterized protein n=1 Tax=Serendipita indica (strain DSM 11827) TaxID=1109443 RepID=G4U2V4_SERID|nr:hypothetical protein PIIN_08736 [Serendipita indica DSM 11827]
MVFRTARQTTRLCKEPQLLLPLGLPGAQRRCPPKLASASLTKQPRLWGERVLLKALVDTKVELAWWVSAELLQRTEERPGICWWRCHSALTAKAKPAGKERI